MSRSFIKTFSLVILLVSGLVGEVLAEPLGLLNARLADPGKGAGLTFEPGFVHGKLAGVDYQNIAVRANYRISGETLVFGTAGVSEYGETDGLPWGLGVLYHLSRQRISDQIDLSVTASYHKGNYSLREIKGDIDALSFQVLISGAQPLMSNGLSWYANTGYHRISTRFDRSRSHNEAGIGVGMVLPSALGEVYWGLDYAGDMTFGFGIRYFVL